jgi:hypothetical protein
LLFGEFGGDNMHAVIEVRNVILIKVVILFVMLIMME